MVPISLYDNLVDEELVNEIYLLLQNGSFSPKQVSFMGSDIKHMAMTLTLEMEPIRKLYEIISRCIVEPEGFHIDRIYANAGTMGDAPLPHTDTDFDNELTVIYYANPTWQPQYGGETVFFDKESKDIIYSVLPRCGRFIIFQASLLHCARIQNRLGPTFRYSIAFKLFKK